MGDRLRYGDAIALYASLLSDTGTMTGAKHNDFAYPMAWPDYLRLLREGIPQSMLPYHPPSDDPSDEETMAAGMLAMEEMIIGGE